MKYRVEVPVQLFCMLEIEAGSPREAAHVAALAVHADDYFGRFEGIARFDEMEVSRDKDYRKLEPDQKPAVWTYMPDDFFPGAEELNTIKPKPPVELTQGGWDDR